MGGQRGHNGGMPSTPTLNNFEVQSMTMEMKMMNQL